MYIKGLPEYNEERLWRDVDDGYGALYTPYLYVIGQDDLWWIVLEISDDSAHEDMLQPKRYEKELWERN